MIIKTTIIPGPILSRLESYECGQQFFLHSYRMKGKMAFLLGQSQTGIIVSTTPLVYISCLYLEFIPVVPVFPESPHCHLVGSGQGEDTSRQTLGHQGETDPGTNLKKSYQQLDILINMVGWEYEYSLRVPPLSQLTTGLVVFNSISGRKPTS